MIIQHCPIELNTQQVVYGLCGSFFTLNKKKKIDNLAISIFPRSSIKQPKTAFLCKSKVLDKYSQCTWTNNHPHLYTKKGLLLHYAQYNLCLINKQRKSNVLRTESHAMDLFEILYDFINISLQRYLLELMLFVHAPQPA